MLENVISFMNMKGGVGKSTLCVNIAHCLAKEFKSDVLIIDLDPQFNATQYLIPQEDYINKINNESNPDKRKTIYNIFEMRKQKPNIAEGRIEVITNTSIDNLEYKIDDHLYIIPGDLAMVNVEKVAGTSPEHKLKKYIDNKKLREKYKYIFIDCPPTQSIYTLSAFYASDYYIMPVKPDFLSTLGISLFQNAISEYNEDLPHKIKCLGIIFTLVQDGTNHCTAKMREIRSRYKLHTFDNIIAHSIKVPENAEKNICLYDIPNFKQSIINVTQEFIDAFNN